MNLYAILWNNAESHLKLSWSVSPGPSEYVPVRLGQSESIQVHLGLPVPFGISKKDTEKRCKNSLETDTKDMQ